MQFKEALDFLKKSKEFDISNELYLAHGFTTLNNKFEFAEPWHIGYYDEKTDKILTFSVTEHVIEKMDEQEIFKRPETKVLELKPDKVNIDFDKAIETLKQFQQEKFKSEIPNKTIVLLQNDQDSGIIWNFTIISQAMKTLNVKISAQDAKILDRKLTSLFEYKVPDEKQTT